MQTLEQTIKLIDSCKDMKGKEKIRWDYYDSLLKNIPHRMRIRGWDRAAALLERWFIAKANSEPKDGNPDTTTVSMDWVLNWSSAREAYNELIKDEIWKNPAGQRTLIGRLKSKNLFNPFARIRFDFLNPAPLPFSWHQLKPRVHMNHTNTKEITHPFRKANEYVAALGKCSFHVVCKGYTEPISRDSKKKYRVVIEEVGIYLRDTFDFNDRGNFYSQPLGYWSNERILLDENTVEEFKKLCSAFNKYKCEPYPNLFTRDYVDNKLFRWWRERSCHGGDFVIFSDMHTIKLSPVSSFECSF